MTVSWVTPIASGSSRAAMAGAGTAPGGAGRCVIGSLLMSARLKAGGSWTAENGSGK